MVEVVSRVVLDGYSCVILGGDYSLVIGIISGYVWYCLDFCVVWVDVYVDINIFFIILLGNFYG